MIKMWTGACFLLLVLFINTNASVTGIIDLQDKDRVKLLRALTSAFVNLQQNDVDTIYYGAKGFELLKEPIVTVLKMDGCAHLEAQFKKDKSSAETVFHALTTWKILECKGTLHNDATVQSIKNVLDKPTSTADVRFALETLELLKQAVSSPAKVAQAVQQLLKQDDSLLSLGHALHAAALLGTHGKFALDRVEDVVVQADEVDGRMLQWEGGLSITGLLFTGLFRLQGSKPLTQDQADKFAMYFLTRRSVQVPKGALALIEASYALTASSVSPVCITLASSSQVTVDKPELVIRVTDLIGNALKTAPSPVVAQSATRVTDDVVVLSKKPLTPTSKKTEFVLPLNVEPGQYKIAFTAASNSATIITRVLGPVNLKSIEIGVGDSDGSSAPKLLKVDYPQKLTTRLQADGNQNLIAKFSLPRTVHQAFLRLYTDKKEIIFIAEKDNTQMYKINVNLLSELSYSGSYDIELILGDAIMSNPFRWLLGNIEVKLGTTEPTKQSTRVAKPEIQHMFRVAEKRPPQMVSMLFTAAVAAPLLILFILWFKIGVPLKYFNVYSIPFHVGLAGILLLYTYFWLCGNMFTTCAWLLYIGGFTFFTGNRLLSNIAASKK